jgi:hypothetical protein
MSALSRAAGRFFSGLARRSARRAERRAERRAVSAGRPGVRVEYRIRGLGSVQRAFDDFAADVTEGLPQALAEAGELVRKDAYDRFAPISPASAAGFKVRVRKRGAVVAQGKRKKTGQRPDFGRLQMTRALRPALSSNEAEAVRIVRRMVDDACRDFNRKGGTFNF